MYKEQHIHDLSDLEANYKCHNNDGYTTSNRIVIKIKDSLHSFDANGIHVGGGEHLKKMMIEPLPTHKPAKWVTLTTVNGDKVQLEWKPTHIRYGRGVMLFNRSSTIASGLENLIGTYRTIGVNSANESLQVYEKNGDNLTPIPPPNPLLDKIAELRKKHRQCWQINDADLEELETLIKETTNGHK